MANKNTASNCLFEQFIKKRTNSIYRSVNRYWKRKFDELLVEKDFLKKEVLDNQKTFTEKENQLTSIITELKTQSLSKNSVITELKSDLLSSMAIIADLKEKSKVVNTVQPKPISNLQSPSVSNTVSPRTDTKKHETPIPTTDPRPTEIVSQVTGIKRSSPSTLIQIERDVKSLSTANNPPSYASVASTDIIELSTEKIISIIKIESENTSLRYFSVSDISKIITNNLGTLPVDSFNRIRNRCFVYVFTNIPQKLSLWIYDKWFDVFCLIPDYQLTYEKFAPDILKNHLPLRNN